MTRTDSECFADPGLNAENL